MKKFYWLVTACVYTPDLYAWHVERWKLFSDKTKAEEYAASLKWTDTQYPNIGTRPTIEKISVADFDEA